MKNLFTVLFLITFFNSQSIAQEERLAEEKRISDSLVLTINPQDLYDNIIESIGGSKALSGVKTILNTADVTIEGAPFKPSATIKSMAPNKTSMEMSVEGMGTIVKQKFDGKNGYVEQQGSRTEMTTDEIVKKQKEKGLFPQSYLNVNQSKILSVLNINGVDAIKIQVNNEDSSFHYYDIKKYLLIRTENKIVSQGQKLTQVSDYSDYKSVNGIMMPHTRTISAGPQLITFTSSEIKINEGVSKKDFN